VLNFNRETGEKMKNILRLAILAILLSSTAVACSFPKPTPTPLPTMTPPSPPPLAAVLPSPATAVPTYNLGEFVGEKMVVGTSANFSPWEYLDAQNNATGFDIDLMREIARRGNVAVEFKDLQDVNALIPALQSGQIQAAIAAMRPTAERRKQADFTNFYHYTSQAIVTNPTLPITINDPKDVVRYALGVEKDTALDAWVIYDLIKPGLLPLDNLNRYNNSAEIVDALTKTEILIGLMDSFTAVQYQNNNQVKILWSDQITADGMAIAVKKDNEPFLKELNAIISGMQNEGFISRLESTYLASH
jgi:polar amino acid transport system substrate-binding protein